MKFEEVLPYYDKGYTIRQIETKHVFNKNDGESCHCYLQNLNKFTWEVVNKDYPVNDQERVCLLLEQILKQLKQIYYHPRQDGKDF